MNLRFLFPFFISGLLALLTALFGGFLFEQDRRIEREELYLKNNLKLSGALYKERWQRQRDLLTREMESRPHRMDFSQSPLFALLTIKEDQTTEADFASLEMWPAGLRQKLSSTPENGAEEQREAPLREEKDTKREEPDVKAFLREIVEKVLSEKSGDSFLSQPFPHGEKGAFKFFRNFKPALVVFFQSLDNGGWRIAFFKEDRAFFTLKDFSSGRKGKEAFVLNREGRIVFHSSESKIFKSFSKKSFVWKSIEQFRKSPRQTALKEKGQKIYYFQKVGGLYLVVKSSLPPPPLFYFGDFSFISGFLCLLLFCLALTFFFVRIFSLSRAYHFLKLAFLSFSRTGTFPPSPSSKNSLLYFYGNRRDFLSDRFQEEERRASPSDLNFRDLVLREAEKLRDRFPGLCIEEKFDFDVKVFGFEKFARALIQELLSNAAEAMGGLKEPRIDLSLKKQGEELVFCVKDYGTGVPDKDYKKMLRMYYSTKSQTGAGLNVVQTIVQSNGGRLEFSSPDRGGLRVCVFLPLKCFLQNHSASLEGGPGVKDGKGE